MRLPLNAPRLLRAAGVAALRYLRSLDDSAERAPVVGVLLLEHLANVGVDLLPQDRLDVAVEAVPLAEGPGEGLSFALLAPVDDDVFGREVGAQVDGDANEL